jgi:hypothetical protein
MRAFARWAARPAIGLGTPASSMDGNLRADGVQIGAFETN